MMKRDKRVWIFGIIAAATTIIGIYTHMPINMNSIFWDIFVILNIIYAFQIGTITFSVLGIANVYAIKDPLSLRAKIGKWLSIISLIITLLELLTIGVVSLWLGRYY